MNLRERWRSLLVAHRSLRTRLSLSVMLIALASTLGVAAVAAFYVRANTQDVIVSDQFKRTVAIAEAIDQKFITRRVVIQTFAESLEAQQLRGTGQLQPYLQRHLSLPEVFDNVTVIDLSGNPVANYTGPQSIGRFNVADRQYFKDTIASGKGLISQPIRNRVTGASQVVMTEPVHDERGAIVYVINALISLDQPNFLGELTTLKFGDSGYVFITNTDGIVIHSPRESRILKHFNAEGDHNVATTRAVAGFEGSIDAVNRVGVRALYAFKQTRQTNWIVGSHYPYDEAFAVLRRLELLTTLGAIALSLLVGGFSLYLLRRQLAPLARLHQHMLDSHAAAQYVPRTSEHPADELGDLARTFDRLMVERNAAQNTLVLQARVDPLTGLANRLAFHEALPLMLARARRHGHALALMYLDIDHFKTINDTLGHAAGDEVLCEFARRLQTSVRTTDLVVRLGGDEFVVVLEDLADADVAGAVAEKIVGHVERPVFDVHSRALSVSTSIGIAFHAAASPPTTASELLARADAALYAAKVGGRNRFEFATHCQTVSLGAPPAGAGRTEAEHTFQSNNAP